METLSSRLKALADPVRLAMLDASGWRVRL
jgi:hypothetical protein